MPQRWPISARFIGMKILVILMINTNPIAAQQPTPTLLWQVTGKNIRDTSYLFGTFHEISPSFFIKYPKAMQLLQHADKVVLETKLSGNQLADNTPVSQYDRKKWEQLLKPAQLAIFQQFTARAEDSSYYSMTPVYAALTLNRSYIKSYCETDPDSFNMRMDDFIEQEGQKNNKPIIGLEENQTSILNDISTTTSDSKLYADLVITLMEQMLADATASPVCTLVRQYRQLELDYQLEQPAPPLNADLLHDRNMSWLKQLPSLFARGRCFIAVGIRHLCYNEGLICALRKQGYTVTPVIAKNNL